MSLSIAENIQFQDPKDIFSNEYYINFNADWNNPHVPSPLKIIDSLNNLQINFTYFKLFSREIKVLDALSKNNKKILVAFNNWELKKILEDPYFALNEVLKLYPYRNSISTVIIGNEPLGIWYNNTFKKYLAPATFEISKLVKEYLPNSDITIPFNFAIFKNTYPPSNSVLHHNDKFTVLECISIIQNHSLSSPFMINIYPFLTYLMNKNNIDFDFAIGNPTFSIVYDKPYIYNSLMALMYDSVVVALEKENIHIQIDIGEIGWPSKGNKYTNNYKHCLAINNLIIQQKVGTPRYPYPIKTYLFEAIDESWKDISAGKTERHWGLFTNDVTYKCNKYSFLSTNPQISPFILTVGLFSFCLPFLYFIYIVCFKKYKKKNYNYYQVNYSKYETIL